MGVSSRRAGCRRELLEGSIYPTSLTFQCPKWALVGFEFSRHPAPVRPLIDERVQAANEQPRAEKKSSLLAVVVMDY